MKMGQEKGANERKVEQSPGLSESKISISRSSFSLSASRRDRRGARDRALYICNSWPLSHSVARFFPLLFGRDARPFCQVAARNSRASFRLLKPSTWPVSFEKEQCFRFEGACFPERVATVSPQGNETCINNYKHCIKEASDCFPSRVKH